MYEALAPNLRRQAERSMAQFEEMLTLSAGQEKSVLEATIEAHLEVVHIWVLFYVFVTE